MKVQAILHIANFLTVIAILVAFITVYGYLEYDLETVKHANLAVVILVCTFLFNLWAFSKQISLNKVKKLRYYLDVVYSKRVAAGWDGMFTLDENIKVTAIVFWIYLPIVYSGFSNDLVRAIFIIEGLLIAAILAHSSYKFETGQKVYESRTPFWYAAWLSQPGLVLSVLLLVGAVIITKNPSPELIPIISFIVILFFLRQFLPQRWFGPNAVRQAYKKLGQPGYI